MPQCSPSIHEELDEDWIDDASERGAYATFMCRCCGKPVSDPSHRTVRMLRFSSEERSCLIGRCGITIQELTRRCRVCITVLPRFVLIGGPTEDIVGHAVLMVCGRVKRAFQARDDQQHYRGLLSRSRQRTGDPMEFLASRPPRQWRLDEGRLENQNPATTPQSSRASAATVVPKEKSARLSISSVSWRSIARQQVRGA